jgi:UDP-N-acetylglucosamine 2-epimerase
VLIVRSTTERPELVEAGGARLVGVKRESITRHAFALLRSRARYSDMCLAYNPFGDGHAVSRIVAVVESELVQERPTVPAHTAWAQPQHERLRRSQMPRTADRPLDSR